MNRLGYGALLAAAVLILVPVWAAPYLVTTDGPSHVYNAVVGTRVASGEGPYALWHSYDGALGPQRAAGTLLTAAIPLLGPERAEKALFTLIILSTLFLLFRFASSGHSGSPAVVVALVPLCAWLAQHWFAWMGFYDFSLSVVGFLALLVVQQQAHERFRDVLTQVIALLIAWAHLFTFAVAVGTILWLAVLRYREHRSWLRAIAPALFPVVLLLAVLQGGHVGGGATLFGDKLKAVAGLAVGDFLLTLHPVDVLAGTFIMLCFWSAFVFAVRGRKRARRTAPDPGFITLCAFLVAGSLIAPDAIGDGSYIGARLRFLAVVAGVPAIGALAAHVSSRVRTIVALALAGTLVAHTIIGTRLAQRAGAEAEAIARALDKAGAAPGDGMLTALADHERGFFRISAYAHISKRAAVERSLLVLDNYEAELPVFQTNWVQRPQSLYTPINGHEVVLRVRAGAPWALPIHIVHDAGVTVRSGDPRVVVLQNVTDSGSAVTTAVFRNGAQ